MTNATTTRRSVRSLPLAARAFRLRVAGLAETHRLRKLIFGTALAAMMLGCATAPRPAVPAETVGQLAPAAYGHSVSAPVHHDAPPEFAGVVGSDDDQVGETITTVTRTADAGSDAAAELPEVAPKTDGIQMGEVR